MQRVQCQCPRLSVHAARRALAAISSDARDRRSSASPVPRPTYCSRASKRRAFSRTAVIAHLLRRSHTSALLASSSLRALIVRRWRRTPLAAIWPSSCVTSGDASPQDPNTKPRTGSYVRSLCSTGPASPATTPQKHRSTRCAFPRYSPGSAFARLFTAAHRS